MGFAHPEVLEKMKKEEEENPAGQRYTSYMAQEHLNVRFKGVCDVFNKHARRGSYALANGGKKRDLSKIKNPVKIYGHYKEMLADPEIDAVIIATPDHWHAQMIIDAAKAGKHVYSEKCMVRTLYEAYAVRDAVRQSGIIFQLGHQGRQTESYHIAREAIRKNVPGQVSLIQVTTNRNDPQGAWVYKIDPKATPGNINWKEFLGKAPFVPFDAARYHRWRCWWDYGTGLFGDLLTHEYDAINQIMEMGIPESVSSSGGIYYFRDGREVPDVLQVSMEYPDRGFTLLYSATQANQHDRGKLIMGHDATIDLGHRLTIMPDARSERYREQLQNGRLKAGEPMYAYEPGKEGLDAVSTATSEYFASRGLMYTFRKGRRVNTTYLHTKEWLNGIRHARQPSCNIKAGFEEAVTAMMATTAYREKRVVRWDADREKML
jgi:predicted dehydrogenase